MSLGKRIREYRIKRGYTQGQMAEKLEMTEANFSSYERDKSVPPSEKLRRMALILDVSTDFLLGRSFDPTPYSDETEKDAEVEEEVRTLARDIHEMDTHDRDLLKDLIKTMQQRAKEAKNDK